MIKPEILSPVGSWEMLEAAVLCGADAVYLGFKEFSARRNAENFDFESLCGAIKYCHIRGVKVYLTLNIILKDSELADALDVATRAYNMGIDGIIIADLGLAAILHKALPLLPLHASTQCSVHSPSALKPLKELGFSRVVVARELSLSNLTEICEKAKELDLEIEAFVHGALCMSVSGQCLLSAFLGSRSGNRGLCAGPCRLPFSVENGTGYDLSLKDLSLLNYTETLKKIGVNSFKIEGRMKRPEYVAAATAAFKSALDNGQANEELSDTLKNVFSRSGFTSGYLENRLGADMFGIRTKDDVISASDAIPKIHEMYRREVGRVKIDVKGFFKALKPISLELSDGENTVIASGNIPQLAKTKSMQKGDIEKNLLKFGSTPYSPQNIEIVLEEGLFIPSSALNELRRNAVELLNEKRSVSKNTPVETKLPILDISENKSESQGIYIRIENISQIPENLTGIDGIILALECDDFKNINADIPLIADIPSGIADEDVIFKRLLKFKEAGFSHALCSNLAATELAKRANLEVIASANMNVYNSFAIETVKHLGAQSVILSNEMLITEAQNIKNNIPKGIIAYGKIPLMLFKNCPLKNGKECKDCKKDGFITDRKGVRFPVRCRMGYSEMLNSVPIYMADRLNELSTFDFLVLYFTNEQKAEVEKTIRAYQNGSQPDGSYTRGLLYRGSY